MEPIFLDRAAAIEMLMDSAARKPDGFKYSSGAGYCAYVHNVEEPHEDEPMDFSEAVTGCLIGDGLYDKGLTFAQIVGESGQYNTGCSVHELIPMLSAKGLVRVTPEAKELLRLAQVNQDFKTHSWLECILYAIRGKEVPYADVDYVE